MTTDLVTRPLPDQANQIDNVELLRQALSYFADPKYWGVTGNYGTPKTNRYLPRDCPHEVAQAALAGNAALVEQLVQGTPLDAVIRHIDALHQTALAEGHACEWIIQQLQASPGLNALSLEHWQHLSAAMGMSRAWAIGQHQMFGGKTAQMAALVEDDPTLAQIETTLEQWRENGNKRGWVLYQLEEALGDLDGLTLEHWRHLGAALDYAPGWAYNKLAEHGGPING